LLACGLGVVAVALTLVGTEVTFRVLGIPFKVVALASETMLAQFDSTLGWVYIPNSSQTQEFGDELRPVPMHFDEIGARAASRDRALDDETPTIILVGGSFTMGHGVTYEETFAGQLEAMSDSAFQIVNLGVQAYGTDQALLRLQLHFHEFNTKAVVYTFIDTHVTRNENYDRRILYPSGGFIGTKPRFALLPNGAVALDKQPIAYEDYKYWRILALIEVVRRRRGPPPTFDLTGALIQEMKRYVESNGAEFLTVHWSRTDEDPILRDQDLNLIDTALEAPADWDEWVIPGDGHPSPRGHAFVGELIAERLFPLLNGPD